MNATAQSRKPDSFDANQARIAAITPAGSRGVWVEIDDNEELVLVDLQCTDIPDRKQLKKFVHDCHELAGNLGYGIVFNEARA